MVNLKKILPFFALIIGLSLAVATSSFRTKPVSNDTEFFWVLKSGTVASTDENAYEEGTNSCSRQIHFCGFFAPKDGVADKPLIQTSSTVYSDLSDLNADPDGHYNDSGKITFMDNE